MLSNNLWKHPKMPAISTSFNRFLCLLLLLGPAISACADELPSLTDPQLQWLGERVYANECSSQFACLTGWNEGETFPSLGIGHFIWYQQGQTEVFEETFPALLAWLEASGARLPEWLVRDSERDSPWRSREQFLAEFDSERSRQLREFLAQTQGLQAAFIAQRLQSQLPDILAAHEGKQLAVIKSHFYYIANYSPPFGLYALIDYLHFKGSGANPAERYNNQGWGLLQVLENMDAPSMASYINAAEYVLERRVINAPAERNEQRWLAGWKNRVRAYMPAEDSTPP